ncbi:hypothetical protein ACTXT7_012740 [Hymenolepis weldensis]
MRCEAKFMEKTIFKERYIEDGNINLIELDWIGELDFIQVRCHFTRVDNKQISYLCPPETLASDPSTQFESKFCLILPRLIDYSAKEISRRVGTICPGQQNLETDRREHYLRMLIQVCGAYNATKAGQKNLVRVRTFWKVCDCYRSHKSSSLYSIGITPGQMQEISEAFALFDNDKDNQLNPSEFKAALLVLGFDFNLKEYADIFQCINLESAKKIPFKDFLEIAKKLLESQDPITQAVRAFKLFDADYSGKISFRELRQITGSIGIAAFSRAFFMRNKFYDLNTGCLRHISSRDYFIDPSI